MSNAKTRQKKVNKQEKPNKDVEALTKFFQLLAQIDKREKVVKTS